MKKFIILIILVVSYTNIFAFLTQANWRWRNDDGLQTTATWKANQNTTAIQTATGEIWRLRIEVYNNTGNPVDLLDTLQYATSPAGPWTNIDIVAGSNPFKIAGISAFVTQAEPTSALLSGLPYTFSQGKIMVDSMVLKYLMLPDQRRTEFEWTIKSNSTIVPNTTYYFRQWGSTINNLDAGMTYPSLTTAAVLPVKLTDFSVRRDDKRVKLEWRAASEQNNDRFEIARSSDGRTWTTIAKINGQGTSTAPNIYREYDETPLSGINYYVIKHYDVDGHSYLSEIKFIKMPEIKSIISVYPNPAHSGINFSLVNKGVSNLRVILTNTNGGVIHDEVFKNVPANAFNKLHLQRQPAAGIYILKLKAEGVSETARVIIE